MSTAAPNTQEASSSPDEKVSPFLNEVGIELIKRYTPARVYNGFGRFSPYKTEFGEYCVGYGSKEMFGKAVFVGTSVTKKEIEDQLLKDLKPFAKLVEHYVLMPLNEKKRGALLSYAHSIGLAKFKECRLLELINSRASKIEIIKEWSPYINRKDFYPENLRDRRRTELNTYVAPDSEVPLLFKHNCLMKQCLANLGESYQGTPTQMKAIEYLERKIVAWDKTGEVMRRFWRLWNQEQGCLGSPKNL